MTALKQLMTAPILRQNEVSLGSLVQSPSLSWALSAPFCPWYHCSWPVSSLGFCWASPVLSLGPFVSSLGVPGILLASPGPLVLGLISISCVFRPKTCNATRKAFVLRRSETTSKLTTTNHRNLAETIANITILP